MRTPGYLPTHPRTRTREDLQRGLPLVQPEPVPRTGPMMTRDTLRGRLRPAAPTVPRTATGRWRALTSPEFGLPLELSWAPTGSPGLAGLPDRWAPGSVVACAST